MTSEAKWVVCWKGNYGWRAEDETLTAAVKRVVEAAQTLAEQIVFVGRDNPDEYNYAIDGINEALAALAAAEKQA